MPVSGLLALLDDIASMADGVGTMTAVAAQKGAVVADDVATLTAAAAKKATGIVTDDMAVTAEQAIGIRREREIPVVIAVAKGSFKNKALYLAPGALVLNAVAPWSITPLLMAGGTFLAYEGVEKVLHKLRPGHDDPHDAHESVIEDPEEYERGRVAGAIRTDLILSGEIIALTLGQIAHSPFITQVGVLYAVSVVMTIGVYGIVGVLVKLDDAGEVLVMRGGPNAAIGRLLLRGAPILLHVISYVGMFAMMMVGGHILIEGIPPLHDVVHHWLEHGPHGVLGYLIDAAVAIAVGGVAGLVVFGALATGVPGALWSKIRPARAH
jgi:predicted DNA repair protein MutK